ncbi:MULTISPECIES: disulfide bond formation protein B [Pseudomonas]|jgi:disulfide bond formation protein DsbB|uniref:Disulfide bond formation protein B n=1 Tax=Pseudomonas putida TaxID=303 RepID=A0A379KH65_PSEPU|nr:MULTISPECIES: disulfide bond formation protein B [Pseudomonas]QPN45732.1 disulfide bond formation protein B [Priestia aryabhattai]KAF1311536.1 disulfide bond formation protein B [Pseudomonas sp. SG-MS2]MBG6125232.1 disulfide bond formation protein DsbB [Pseudomonas sp. M2]MBM7398754.1 disulfide bond formation protein DsbB [Pseudomonas sp. M5]NSX18613.1 disulfide bond formation protein B [Pseudomonas putida]
MLPARLRTFFLPACLASLAVLVASFYLERTLGLVPCPLCFSQRFLLGVYAMICLCAAVHASGVAAVCQYARAALGCSAAGALLAARHVWIQGEIGTSHECPAPFWHVVESSWREAARQLLLGGPDCSSLTWSFLDLTLPEWSLLAFLLLAVLPLTCLLAYRFRTLGKA